MIKAPIDPQELRRRTYRKAKSEKTHRFRGLFVHVTKIETLEEAYRIAKGNGGAPGIDGRTFEDIESSGGDGFLAEMGNILCVEDPIPRLMLSEYRRLRGFSAIPIVLYISLPYFEEGQRISDPIVALEQSAVDGFNFNTGLAKFQLFDHIAVAANLPCWHGSELDLGILEAMYLHSCAAATSCVWPSDIFGRLIRSHDLLKQPLEIAPHTLSCPPGRAWEWN